MNLSSDTRRYLVIGYVLIPSVFNVSIPLVLGLLVFRGQTTVPIWTFANGAVTDFLATCYLLPAITCLIVTPIVHRDVARGVVPSVRPEHVPWFLKYYRGGLFIRSIRFGLTVLLLLFGPVLVGWSIPGFESVPTTTFLVVKILFTVTLGCVVTPLIALAALSDGSPDPAIDDSVRAP